MILQTDFLALFDDNNGNWRISGWNMWFEDALTSSMRHFAVWWKADRSILFYFGRIFTIHSPPTGTKRLGLFVHHSACMHSLIHMNMNSKRGDGAKFQLQWMIIIGINHNGKCIRPDWKSQLRGDASTGVCIISFLVFHNFMDDNKHNDRQNTKAMRYLYSLKRIHYNNQSATFISKFWISINKKRSKIR